MGWTKEIQKEGAGPKPTRGKTVFVHCTGVVKESGHTFWSTKWDASKGGGVFSFKLGLGQVIPVSNTVRINPLRASVAPALQSHSRLCLCSPKAGVGRGRCNHVDWRGGSNHGNSRGQSVLD